MTIISPQPMVEPAQRSAAWELARLLYLARWFLYPQVFECLGAALAQSWWRETQTHQKRASHITTALSCCGPREERDRSPCAKNERSMSSYLDRAGRRACKTMVHRNEPHQLRRSSPTPTVSSRCATFHVARAAYMRSIGNTRTSMFKRFPAHDSTLQTVHLDKQVEEHDAHRADGDRPSACLSYRALMGRDNKNRKEEAMEKTPWRDPPHDPHSIMKTEACIGASKLVCESRQ